MPAPNRPTGINLLVVLSGPSGVGKDAVTSCLQERLKDRGNVYFPVTATTRPIRPGEVDGEDYLFVSRLRFEDLLARGELLEHAEVHAHYYGVPRDQIREALLRGQDVFVQVDVQGADTIRSLAPDSVTIFLAPPDMEALEDRLTGRGTESPEALAARLAVAHSEMKEAAKFHHVVVNRDGRLAEAADRILRIMEEERASGRPRRYEV